MKQLAEILFLSLLPLFIFSQKSVKASKIDHTIIIDGVLNDDEWSTAEITKDYNQYFPTDTLLAQSDTEMSFTYDDNNLYVGIKCYGVGNDWIVSSLKRDFRAGGNDNITLLFDTFNDKTNAVFFGINPEGVIREGTITNGGTSFRNFDESWDNKWRGEAKIYDGYYTAELEIPFKILRFSEGTKSWNLGSYRFDTQANENSTWTDIPREQTLFCLAYNGVLEFEEPLRSSGKNISLIPYVTSGLSKDHLLDTDSDYNFDAGMDAKIGITSGLNLDLTINPDFSQVEVDRQVTNLDRFEIFFPERRQFFLENADLFSGFGFGSINPFFSRRIGVDENKDEEIVQNRIYAGARLSGKINDNLRIGLLNMQTAKDDIEQLNGYNYTVLALQHKIFSRSNISFIAVNKFNNIKYEQAEDRNNKVIGVDFNFADASNEWIGKTFLHTSFTQDIDEPKIAHGTEVRYIKKNYDLAWAHEVVQNGYDAEVGFIRRSDYKRVNPSIRYRIFPSSGSVNRIDFGLDGSVFWKPDFGKTDHFYSFNVSSQFNNSSRLEFRLSNQFIYLLDEFDPTGTDAEISLDDDSDYTFTFGSLSYRSDRRQDLFYNITTLYGQYFNGKRVGVRGNLGYRYQPYGSISINYSWNSFDMPYLDDTRQTLLLGPRLDYTFSKKLFFSSFVQYNTQTNNTNINTRLQWRFSPASDFFIVYSENYFTGQDPSDRFQVDIENRAIVAKMTYWFNI